MSLRFFHVVFIIASMGLTLWMGVWALGQGGGGWTAVAVACFAAFAGLVVYGVWFVRKTRGLES